jgi:hypothetical protein
MYCQNRKRDKNKQADIYFSELREVKLHNGGNRYVLFLG